MYPIPGYRYEVVTEVTEFVGLGKVLYRTLPTSPGFGMVLYRSHRTVRVRVIPGYVPRFYKKAYPTEHNLDIFRSVVENAPLVGRQSHY